MKQLKHKKVLAILGSPHKNGINAQMLQVAITQAQKIGCTVETVNLYEKNIAFCKGCLQCAKAKQCVFRDDISEIEQKIKDCDILFLAAPVYWGNVPAVVKNMFDRLHGIAMEDTKTFPRPLLKGRDCFLMTSCTTPMPFAYLFRQSSGAIRAMKEFFRYAGIRYKGSVVCSNASRIKNLHDRKRREIQRKIWRLVK